MSKLQEIMRGAVIAGRYVVSEELRPWLPQFPDHGSIFLALDAILDVPVIVYAAPKSVSGDLLDAGRRSALLSDPRIPSITDVGTWEGFDFVVCERTGGTSLARILQKGPLLEPEARAIVGELATALTHAANRGLHHGLLGPESVAITPEQEVIVRGIAIDAAVADEPLELNLQQMSPAVAKRRDALSLVNILYACLSAHWPGDEPRAGLPASGRKNNRIVTLDALVDTFGIPADIESFASNVVSGIEPGPRSPSEIVRFLGTWDTSVLTKLDQTARTEDELFATAAQPAAPPAAQPATTSGEVRTSTGTAAEPELPHTHRKRASQEQLAAALSRVGLIRPGTLGVSAGVAGTGYDQYDDQMAMRSASMFPIAADKLDPESSWPEPFDEGTQADEYDPNMTAPLLRGEDDDPNPNTAAIDIVEEADGYDDDGEDSGEDDGSWFLGGMFETREQKFANQKAEFERERRLQRQAQERLNAQRERQGQDSQEDLPEPKRAFNIKPAGDVDRRVFAAGAIGGAGAVAGKSAAEKSDSAQSAAAGDSSASAKSSNSAQASNSAHAAGRDKSSGAQKTSGETDGKGSAAGGDSAAGKKAASGGAGTAAAAQAGGAGKTGGAGNAKTSGARGQSAAAQPSARGASAAAAGAGAGSSAAAAAKDKAAVNGKSAGTSARADTTAGAAADSQEKKSAVLPAVLIGLAVLAVIALLFVFIRPGGGEDQVTAPPATESPAAEPTEEPVPEEPAEPADITIAKATALDPEGDGKENNSMAKNVLPGVKGSWQSDRYNSAEFGGLKKGLGLALKLEKAAEVAAVQVESSFDGGAFDVLVGDGKKIGDAAKVGSGTFTADKPAEVTFDDKVSGEYVFIWITELPKGDEGFRARIPKISITG